MIDKFKVLLAFNFLLRCCCKRINDSIVLQLFFMYIHVVNIYGGVFKS